jgi:hypothetical protein
MEKGARRPKHFLSRRRTASAFRTVGYTTVSVKSKMNQPCRRLITLLDIVGIEK